MDLINLLPSVKRARNFYLYNNNGDRILDLFLDGGTAIAGHRPSGLSLAIKNTISRGLYAPYPSIYSGRIKKLVLSEFPQFHQFGIYRSIERFLNLNAINREISDPVFSEGGSECCFWRPYLPVDDDCRTLIIQFPFPGSDVIVVLSRDIKKLPQSDLISPYISSGLIRSYYDLKKRMKETDIVRWSLLDDTKHWKRTGPYLIPLCSEKEYETLFKLYLSCNILISPYYSIPSIFAVDLSDGDLKALYRKIKEK